MERRLAAILAADVVGYSRLMGEDEAGTLAALKVHRRELIDPRIAVHHGRIVKVMGDGLLVEFPSVVEAVECAIEIQRGMVERNADVPDDRRLELRIGINLGDVIVEDEDIHGDGVNVAARLESLAEPGGICVRRSVRNQVRDKLPLSFEDLGEVEAKNIARPIRVFRVRLDDAAARPPSMTLRRPPAAWRWRALAAGVLVLLAATSVVAWLRPWAPDDTPASVERTAFPLPDQPSVAVLPFDNMSGNPSQEYLGNAITEDITTELSRFADLLVISRESTFALKGQDKTAKQIGRVLGVRYILEGSVQRSGERLRVNAQLIEAQSEAHIWAERYDREVEDLLAVQDDIVRSVVTTVGETIPQRAGSALARKPIENFEAYDYYLRGRDLIQRPTKEANEEARSLLTKAAALDPKLSRAYIGLAWTHLMDYVAQWSEAGPEALERAAEFTNQAAALEGNSYDVHRLLARIRQHQGDHEEALAHSKRALELNPNDGDLLATHALLLLYAGHSAEARPWAEEAMRRNPRYPGWYATVLAAVHYLAGRYREAVAVLSRIDKLAIYDHRVLAASYGQLGKAEKARTHVEAILKIAPDYSVAAYAGSQPYQKKADLEHFLDGLRKAGLPEGP
jgi:adenylate cyclase